MNEVKNLLQSVLICDIFQEKAAEWNSEIDRLGPLETNLDSWCTLAIKIENWRVSNAGDLYSREVLEDSDNDSLEGVVNILPQDDLQKSLQILFQSYLELETRKALSFTTEIADDSLRDSILFQGVVDLTEQSPKNLPQAFQLQCLIKDEEISARAEQHIRPSQS